ncbi:MAG: hypothetical protein FWB78_00175 [Treponema sp.]|nr:hypothetical protein [Treponema sp.]
MYGFCRKKTFALVGAVSLVAFVLLACPTPTGEAPPLPPAPLTRIVGDATFDQATGSITLTWLPVAGAVYFDIHHGPSRLSRNFVYLDTVEGELRFTHTADCPLFNQGRFENYYRITAFSEDFDEIATGYLSLRLSIFGPTVYFFDARHDAMADIVEHINYIHDTKTLGSIPQGDGRIAEFGSRRFTFFFLPGDYNLNGTIRIGFYTHVGGLGRFPSCVRLLNTNVTTPSHLPVNNSTCTFWRSMGNLEITSGNFQWGVSQSSPLRRMLVRVPTQFNYNFGAASGGFTADSWFSGAVALGSQQQWYTRNTHFDGPAMGGAVWNSTIQGSTGTINPHQPDGPQTVIEETPVIREPPFLYVDGDGEFRVFVPGIRRNARGISWNDGNGLSGMGTSTENGGMGPGESLDFLAEFYVTRVVVDGVRHVGQDNAASINAQLNAGRHIFFAPGMYEIEAPIVVSRDNTVIMGKGFPSLIPTRGNRHGVIFVDDVPGVTISGLLFDTSTQSVYSVAMGPTGANRDHSDNPSLLADLVLRVGGLFLGPNHVDISVLVNSNNVLGDKLWIWRADHNGLPNEINYIDWHINTSINGFVALGNDVHMYGLFVEHYHQYNTLWIGNGGRIFFHQNETPYDPHFQRLYMSHDGTVNGWAQLKVDNRVTDFVAYGLGFYSVFLDRINATRERMLVANAIEVPHHPGVIINKAITVKIGSPQRGGIQSIINGIGGSTLDSFGVARMTTFSNGVGIVGTGSGSAAGTVTGSTVATWVPPEEKHWVESLVINSRGIVTANPYGGLPCVSVQFPGSSWNQPPIPDWGN